MSEFALGVLTGVGASVIFIFIAVVYCIIRVSKDDYEDEM